VLEQQLRGSEERFKQAQMAQSAELARVQADDAEELYLAKLQVCGRVVLVCVCVCERVCACMCVSVCMWVRASFWATYCKEWQSYFSEAASILGALAGATLLNIYVVSSFLGVSDSEVHSWSSVCVPVRGSDKHTETCMPHRVCNTQHTHTRTHTYKHTHTRTIAAAGATD
jgi:hypothetical protein